MKYGGKSDTAQDLKTERHNLAVRALNLKIFLIFFSSKSQFVNNEQILAADEGVFAYHIC